MYSSFERLSDLQLRAVACVVLPAISPFEITSEQLTEIQSNIFLAMRNIRENYYSHFKDVGSVSTVHQKIIATASDAGDSHTFKDAGDSLLLSKECALSPSQTQIDAVNLDCRNCRLRHLPFCPVDGLPHKKPIHRLPGRRKRILDFEAGTHLSDISSNNKPLTCMNNIQCSDAIKLKDPDVTNSVSYRSLSAFGFVMKQRSQATAEIRSAKCYVFHDIEDNDDTRLFATLWRSIRRQKTTDFLSTEVKNTVPSAWNAFPLNSFCANATAGALTKWQQADSFIGTSEGMESVLAHWCAEGLEELEPRPAYWGSYTVPLQGIFKFSDHEISLLRDSRDIGEPFENSADEWESEPSDAESCTTKSRSEDDTTDTEELEDFLDRDEIFDLLEDENKKHGMETQERKNRLDFCSQFCKELYQAQVLYDDLENQLGEVTGLLPFQALDGFKNPLFDFTKSPVLPPTYDIQTYPNLITNVTPVIYRKFLEIPRVDKTTIEKQIEICIGKSDKVFQEDYHDAGQISNFTPDIPIRKELINGLLRYVEAHARHGFTTEIMVHEFLKAYPGQCSFREAKCALRVIAFRKSRDLWITRDIPPVQKDETTNEIIKQNTS